MTVAHGPPSVCRTPLRRAAGRDSGLPRFRASLEVFLRRPASRLERVLRFLTLTAIAAASSVSPAYGQATLLSGSVRAVSRGVEEGGVSGDSVSLWFSKLPVVAENIHTGERWETKTDGILNQPFASFKFDSLPPGRYRVLVQGLDENWLGPASGKLRSSETHVVVQEYHSVHVDIVLSPVPHGRSALTAPVTGEIRPSALTETCGGGSPRPDDASGEVRGELWGIVKTPDDKPASGVRVHLEAISGVTQDPFQTSVRTTESGCYGLYGLWSGRYHVFVDEPPFAFDSEVEVPDIRAGASRLDIQLSSDRLKVSLPTLKLGWYSRLGLRDGVLKDVWRAVLQTETELWAASRARTIDSADMAHVSGVVIWPYEPEQVRRSYRIPGVRIAFEHRASGEAIAATTGADGGYDLWLPQGRYIVRIEHPPFAPLAADVLVLPEGLVARSGVVFGPPYQSGISVPQATRRSGIAADLNFTLWLPVQERASVQTTVDESSGVVTVRPGDFGSPSASPTDVSIEKQDVERLPLVSGRTVEAALTFVPGVVATESNGNLAVFTGLGQRRFSNRLTIDGIGVDLAVDVSGLGIGQAGSGALPAVSTLGGTQVLVPLDAVEVMRVQTVGGGPEQRLTPGVQTSVVTRAGSDELTTSYLAQARPGTWSAHDFFENTGRRPRRTTDALTGATSVGGPIVPGRLFGFAAWEGQWIDQRVTASIRAPTQAVRDTASSMVRSILDAYPVGDGRDFGAGLAERTQEFTTGSWFSSFSGRLDAVLSDRHRVFGRFQKGASRGDEIFREELGLPARTFASKESTATTALTVGWAAISSSWMHDLRVSAMQHTGAVDAMTERDTGVARLPVFLFLPEGIGEADASIGIRLFPGSGGALFFGPTTDVGQRQLQFVDSVVLMRGKHQLQVGGAYQRVVSASTPPQYTLFYQFRGISDLQAGEVGSVTVGRLLPARTGRHAWSLFAHDTWQVSRRVLLGLGLRYSVRPAPTSRNDTQPSLVEYESLPMVVPRPAGARLWETSWRDVAPHVSITHELRTRPDWATILHGACGVVVDDLTAPGLIPFGRGDGYVSTAFLGPTTFPLPPGSLEAVIPVLFATEAYAIPTDLRRPRTYEWQVGFEQELGSTQRLGVSYVGTTGRNLTYWSGRNLASDPIYEYSNDAQSEYHALLARYVKRLSYGVQGRVAYAWGHAIDTNSGEELLPNPPSTLVPLQQSRGSADFDRRHLFQVSASYHLSWPRSSRLRKSIGEWDIAVVGTAQSGAPVTVLTHQGEYFVRPDLNPDVPIWIVDSTLPFGRRLNAAAFNAPAEGHGTLGRNVLRASPLRQLDASVSRSVTIGSLTFQIRMDAFNVLSQENFGPPESRLGAVAFGEPKWSYADSLGTGTLRQGGLTPVSQLGGPRSFQLSVRVQM
jgi:hypothetical protein